MNNKPISNCKVVVTSACGTLGKSICQAILSVGAHVIAVDKDPMKLSFLDEKLSDNSSHLTLVPIDFSDINSIAKMQKEINKKIGFVDCIISNIDIAHEMIQTEQLDCSVLEYFMRNHVTSNHALIKLFGNDIKRQAGQFIFTSSTMHNFHDNKKAYLAAYSASKAALEELVLTYAQEIKKTKASANIVYPGYIDSSMLRKIYKNISTLDISNPDDVAQMYLALIQTKQKINGAIIDYSLWKKYKDFSYFYK